MEPPFPNPAAAEANVPFVIPVTGRVRLEAFDVLGRRVATVFEDGEVASGKHTATWALSDVSPGVYVLRLAYDGPGERGVLTERITVVR